MRPPAYPNIGPILDPGKFGAFKTHFSVSVGRRSHLTGILSVGNVLFWHCTCFRAIKVTKIFAVQDLGGQNWTRIWGICGWNLYRGMPGAWLMTLTR